MRSRKGVRFSWVALAATAELWREERRALEMFFAVIPYAECREAEWDAAKALAWRAREAGHTLPWNDYLISATAAARGWRIYARDAHFAKLAGLGGAALYASGYGGGFQPEVELQTDRLRSLARTWKPRGGCVSI